jgi:hypothetical protein
MPLTSYSCWPNMQKRAAVIDSIEDLVPIATYLLNK